ncbi:MAG: hypothetical protein V4819_10065 [Verrucomicrobiota bacterium]
MLAFRAEAVVFSDTPDPLHNTTTPGDNSGWQYEGNVGFLGTPIAPYFYITAKHFGGSIGLVFNFHGDSYTTIGYYETVFSNDVLVTRHYTISGFTETAATGTATDLRIWEVDHAKPFPTYAPLSSGVADLGATATIFGGGAEQGDARSVGTEHKGWQWGASNYRQRWGRNIVTGTVDGGEDYGELLYCDFDKPGIVDECHLSSGDSGGGLFVLESGLWRLAGINFSVSGPFRTGPMGSTFNAALFDMGGLEYLNDPELDEWVSLPEQTENIPSCFYCSRISASLPWILSITGQDGSLPSESHSAWQRLYFTPTEIGNPATTGPLADFDGDGIGNLLEFAFNLDPSFNERVTLLSNTGLRGLPLVSVETISGPDHLTIEFVRRTSTSGAGLTYTPQFSSDLNDWQAVGMETVVAINPRWERVKIVDSIATGSVTKRFARVKVALAD